MNKRKFISTLTLVLSLLATSAYAQESRGTSYLLNGSVAVNAGQYWYQQFSVGQRNGGRVVGRFRASGGSGNDIICFIIDQDGLENFQNGHTVPTYYNSGKITVANINTQLAAGQYYLVFSNTFALLTAKTVAGQITLSQ